MLLMVKLTQQLLVQPQQTKEQLLQVITLTQHLVQLTHRIKEQQLLVDMLILLTLKLIPPQQMLQQLIRKQ